MSVIPKRQKAGEAALIIHRFPKQIQKRIKLAAIGAGRTMYSIIAEACSEWLKKRGK